MRVPHCWRDAATGLDTCAVTFEWLCVSSQPALGASDFSALCARFPRVVVGNVPEMRPNSFGRSGDAARRFALFLDVAYDRRTRVVVTSRCAAIFQDADAADADADADEDTANARPESQSLAARAAFRRAASRWAEMSRGAYGLRLVDHAVHI